MSKRAFTLAEVLVTLGIIGVVAALTLPSLIQKRTNIEVEGKLKKIYSVMNQAILMSEQNNGPKEDWETCNFGEKNDESLSSECRVHFDKYILPYLKYTKTEEFIAGGRYNIAIYFSDGSILVGKTHPKLVDYFFFPNGKNFDKDTFITKNQDGSSQRADCGITYFAFQFCPSYASVKYNYKKAFEPYKNGLNNYTKEILTSSHQYGCNKNSPYKIWCTALIQLNGWKIPEDYPFKVK